LGNIFSLLAGKKNILKRLKNKENETSCAEYIPRLLRMTGTGVRRDIDDLTGTRKSRIDHHRRRRVSPARQSVDVVRLKRGIVYRPSSQRGQTRATTGIVYVVVVTDVVVIIVIVVVYAG